MNLGDAQTEATKRCRRCGEDKPIAAFGFQRLNRDGLKPYCAPCQSKMAREWQRANPQKAASAKHNTYYKHYAKRFSVWKLDGSMDGLYHFYGRALQADPCAYCGDAGGDLDHIIPIEEVRRGRATKRTEWENLTAACHRCNVRKERASLLEFLAWPRGWMTST